MDFLQFIFILSFFLSLWSFFLRFTMLVWPHCSNKMLILCISRNELKQILLIIKGNKYFMCWSLANSILLWNITKFQLYLFKLVIKFPSYSENNSTITKQLKLCVISTYFRVKYLRYNMPKSMVQSQIHSIWSRKVPN